MDNINKAKGLVTSLKKMITKECDYEWLEVQKMLTEVWLVLDDLGDDK